MCHANRGKRGGRTRRINVIVSNRTSLNKSTQTDSNISNLIQVPLLTDFEHSIEVIISKRPNELIRPPKQITNKGTVNITPIQVHASSKSIQVGVLNLQSACNKVDQVSDYIIESKSDVVFLSETWVSENNTHTCDQFTPPGYTTHHISRKGQSGGGVGIVTKNALRATPIENTQFSTFEHGIVRLKSKDSYVTAITIYRPPGHINKQFLSEFTDLLETFSLAKDRILLCGDFNIHVDSPSDSAVLNFQAVLNEFDLIQHTRGPTHISGHTLDLVITRSNDGLLRNIPNTRSLFSDHFAVEFQCNLEFECEPAPTIWFRKKTKLISRHLKRIFRILTKPTTLCWIRIPY